MDPDRPVVRWWPLLAAVGAVLVLSYAGVLPTWAGLGHEVALPPLDLVSDLGVVTARSTSVPWFVVGVVAAVLGRATLLACLLGWTRRRFLRALRFYLVALVPAWLASALFDTAQVSLYSLEFWAGLAVAAVTFVALAAVPWRDRGVLSGLAASVTRGARFPTAVAYLTLLTALSGAARLTGVTGQRTAVGLSAALTLATAVRLVAPGSRPGRARVAVVGLAAAAFVVSQLLPSSAPPAAGFPPGALPRGSLLLVAGVDTSSGHGTMFLLRPGTLGFTCAHTYYFSYRGPGPGAAHGQAACPIRTGAPYRRTDTERPLAQLEAAFSAEVAPLPPPVTVVTHSEGSWIAWGAVSSGRAGAVRRLVELAPLADPLGYPPPGRSGPNLLGSYSARLATGIGRSTGVSTFRLDAPLAATLLGRPAALARLLARPLPPGVRALSVPAAFDLPLLVGRTHPFPRGAVACPSPDGHSGVVTSPRTAAVVARFLAGRAPSPCPPWETWPGVVAAGFRLPDPPR